jgi:type II secretory pathway pseudopilin PulG
MSGHIVSYRAGSLQRALVRVFSNYKWGFSRVDVIVLSAIVALLASLVLPAVQRARESARRAQCQSNLQTLGIALHAYHDAAQSFPPAVIWSGPPGEPWLEGLWPIGWYDRIAMGKAPATERDRVCANWLIMLLPALHQEELARAYNADVPVADPANAGVRTAELAVVKCPSDTFNTHVNHYVRDLIAGTRSNEYARGNYGINAGPDRGCFIGKRPGCADGFHVDSTDLAHKNLVVWGTGFAGFNYCISLTDIKNGTSNMVAVDEIRAGIDPADPRGSWALGFPGASMTFRHGLVSKAEDAHGPNNADPDSDDIVGCKDICARRGRDYLSSVGMPCHSNLPESNAQATSRSMHPSGVNVLLADGAARFVSDAIDPNIWYSIHSLSSKPPEDW